MTASWPPWSKPLQPERENGASLDSLALDAVRPVSLREVMAWETRWQRVVFRTLLPIDVLTDFGVDPISLTDCQGRSLVHIHPGQADNSVRFELYHTVGAQDAVMEMELADTQFNQIEVLWLAIQDPSGPRFDIDVMPDGQSTMRGVLRRNEAAEAAAMAAGLAPGQIRPGLGAFSHLALRLESFMSCLNQREYIAQPLYYHTAVLFERIGCAYIHGHARMERIDRGFAPGGDLRAKLDGSTPFRRPELADSVRGRAWAIHAGILDPPWDRVRMVKRLGINAEVDTCPGLPW